MHVTNDVIDVFVKNDQFAELGGNEKLSELFNRSFLVYPHDLFAGYQALANLDLGQFLGILHQLRVQVVDLFRHGCLKQVLQIASL